MLRVRLPRYASPGGNALVRIAELAIKVQSTGVWLCFIGAIALVPAQPPIRVAFLGTSITCGLGANETFPPKVVAGLESRLQRKVVSYNLCFGGAHSYTTLLLLKHIAIPWTPDLVIVETGALDGFEPPLSKPAIEQIFHELVTARIPSVFLARSARCSTENSRQTILTLGSLYGVPVATVNPETLPDGCHPSNLGHAEIAAAILKTTTFPDKPAPPARPPPLPNAQFQPAAQLRLSGPAETVPLTFFKNSGAALKAPPGLSEWRFRIHGPLAAVLFRLDRTPVSLEYQIDGQPWRSVAVHPSWFLNYYLESDLSNEPHELGLRLQAGPHGVIIDGFER